MNIIRYLLVLLALTGPATAADVAPNFKQDSTSGLLSVKDRAGAYAPIGTAAGGIFSPIFVSCAANLVIASPNGAPGNPGCRALVAADLPSPLALPGAFSVTGASTLAALSATNGTFSGTLGVTGASTLAALSATNGTFSGTLGVTGASTLGTLNATNGTFSGTLGVTGASTIAALSATTGSFSSNLSAGGTLGVTGASTLAALSATTGTFSGTLGVTGASTLGTLNATNGTFSGTLGVTGASTIAALSATTGTFSSNLSTGGTLGVTGASTLAALSATTGTFSGDITTPGSYNATGSGAVGFDLTSGTYTHDIKLKSIKWTAVAVSALPTCNAGNQDMMMRVTDANATTFNSTVAGGGANRMTVVCDGTNWKIQ